MSNLLVVGKLGVTSHQYTSPIVLALFTSDNSPRPQIAKGSLGIDIGEGGVESMGLHEPSLGSSDIIIGAISRNWREDAGYIVLKRFS